MAFKNRWPTVRFLDDYFELAGLANVNPNYLGMIDQVICSRGQYFIGTWFSTFTGYITRMRGYFGKHDHTGMDHSLTYLLTGSLTHSLQSGTVIRSTATGFSMMKSLDSPFTCENSIIVGLI